MSGATTSDRTRKTALIAAVVVVIIVVVSLVVARRADDTPPLDRALVLLGQERKFDSSREAVVHFADVYQDLVDAAAAFPKDCDTSTDQHEGACLALNQAASWSLNFSTAAADCTQPAVQQGRLDLRRYLEAAKALDDAATEPPPLPSLPSC
jgi:hypothetical protein